MYGIIHTILSILVMSIQIFYLIFAMPLQRLLKIYTYNIIIVPKDIIVRVIADQNESINKLLSGHIIKSYLSINENLLGNGIVGIITGIRRCGKSVLAELIFSEGKFSYINFDDPGISIKAEDLNQVLEAMY